MSARKEKKIISFIAGLKEKKIRSYFCNEINIIRLMPNLLIKVKKSTTGAYSSQISKYEKKKKEKDLSFLANMILLKNEAFSQIVYLYPCIKCQFFVQFCPPK